ncbi:MAG: hypothetical protein HOP17_04165 [Acidobacteria bacterium]|nr:hypothetical protein [Acidobacteriota bacterium]
MERSRFDAEMKDLAVLDRSHEFENGQVHEDLVCIFLIDPSGVLQPRDELRKKIIAKLERKFSSLDHAWLKTAKFKFVVIYRGQEPSDKEKAAFRKLDFPVYLLTKQHEERTVIELMEKHRIGKTIKNTDIYKYARNAWSLEQNRGLGIPSGQGYRKVGFIKTHKIFEQAGDAAQGFINCIAHEIGHMGNITTHTSSGLMKYPVPMDIDITFADGDRNWFFGDLVRLKKLNPFRIVQIKPTIIREFEPAPSDSASLFFPPNLKHVDHFHLRKTPIPTDRTPTDVQEDKMTPEGMNPGFVDPASDEIIVDKTAGGLDTRFKALISQNYGTFKNEIRAALIDLTGKKLYAPDYAGWNSTVAVYGASSPKVLAIYAAFQLKRDLDRLAITGKITSRATLIRTFNERIRKARISPPPDVNETNFTFAENGTDPVSVNISDGLMAHIKNIHHPDLSNSAARHLIKAVGFGYIGSVTAQAGLWHRNRKGLWLGSSYDGGAGWSSSPVGGFGHNCNALALGTFFTLLAQGRLVEEPSSTQIKSILRGGSWIEIALLNEYQTQVRNGSISSVPDIEVFSKVGLLTQCTAWEEKGGKRKCKSRIATVRQDSALVKRGKVLFVLVVLTQGGASRSNVIERLSIDADRLIEEKNP